MTPEGLIGVTVVCLPSTISICYTGCLAKINPYVTSFENTQPSLNNYRRLMIKYHKDLINLECRPNSIKFPAEAVSNQISEIGSTLNRAVQSHCPEAIKIPFNVQIPKNLNGKLLRTVSLARSPIKPYKTSLRPLVTSLEINSRPPKSSQDQNKSISDCKIYTQPRLRHDKEVESIIDFHSRFINPFVFMALRQEDSNPSQIKETDKITRVPILLQNSDAPRNLEKRASLSMDIFTAYKRVDKKVKPVSTIFPEDYYIHHCISKNPLLTLPPLPYHPPDFVPTIKFSKDRMEVLKINCKNFLWPEEEKLFKHIMILNEEAIAFEDTERATLKESYFSPYIIPTVPHIPWTMGMQTHSNCTRTTRQSYGCPQIKNSRWSVRTKFILISGLHGLL